MKGAVAYQDASKDTWRGWKWNAIAHAALGFNDRLPPSERARRLSHKTVLYLVGPEDHDRTKALSKGFANHNIIAVDLVEDRVQEVRKQGGLAICGSLQQIVMHWPYDWQIDVIDADLCHGMVRDASELPRCMMASPSIHAESVVSINLMRGRDADSNTLRNSLKTSGELPPEAIKNRAHNWLMSVAMHFADMQYMQNGMPRQTTETGGMRVAMTGQQLNDFKYNSQPKFNHYRSKTSGQYFDSVVHRWGCQLERPEEIVRSELEGVRKWISADLSSKCADGEGVRGRIAALRAVRTVKMRGGQ